MQPVLIAGWEKIRGNVTWTQRLPRIMIWVVVVRSGAGHFVNTQVWLRESEKRRHMWPASQNINWWELQTSLGRPVFSVLLKRQSSRGWEEYVWDTWWTLSKSCSLKMGKEILQQRSLGQDEKWIRASAGLRPSAENISILWRRVEELSYIQHGEWRVLGQMSNNTNGLWEHRLPQERKEGKVRLGWKWWKYAKEWPYLTESY